jgi:hypothetical protein
MSLFERLHKPAATVATTPHTKPFDPDAEVAKFHAYVKRMDNQGRRDAVATIAANNARFSGMR